MTLTPTHMHGTCELCTEPADSLAATVFGAACPACVADLDANLGPCPTCHDDGEILLPFVDGPDLRPCPTCRPWGRLGAPHGGFPGLRSGGVQIIAPAAPGESARPCPDGIVR